VINMDTNVNYTLVGAFVIGIIAAIVMAIIWLSSGLSVVPDKLYVMYSQESVSGLNVDAAVEFNGVKMGSVKSIELNKDDPQLVTVLLSVKSTTPITKGTVATLTSRGITGVAFIALKDVGDDTRPLVALEGQDYPVIRTSPSIFVRVDIALRNLSKNFETIAESFSKLLDKQNLASIKNTLAQLDKVTGTLSKNSPNINKILANTNQMTEEMMPLLRTSITSVQTLNTQTLPVTYRLLENLNDVTRSLNEVTIQLKQNPSVLIRGAAPAPLGPGERR
jgi:phospholipid/cholesterol/gamma-HCH transport system substrate-binding protein